MVAGPFLIPPLNCLFKRKLQIALTFSTIDLLLSNTGQLAADKKHRFLHENQQVEKDENAVKIEKRRKKTSERTLNRPWVRMSVHDALQCTGVLGQAPGPP